MSAIGVLRACYTDEVGLDLVGSCAASSVQDEAESVASGDRNLTSRTRPA
jgi:hypothetical protein